MRIKHPRIFQVFGLFIAGSLLYACDQAESPVEAPAPASPPPAVVESPASVESQSPAAANRQALFGAVHVHTNNSFDAFTNGTVTTPADAYSWAQGGVIKGDRSGAQFRIKTPLDFYAVSDHAEMMGTFVQMTNPDSPLSKHPMATRLTSKDENTALQAFAEVLLDMSSGKLDPAFSDPPLSRSVWSEIVKTADEYYQPGKFTTFAAFEWSSNPNTRNLHRVVVFRDTQNVPDMAFSALDSEVPEDLWAWMELQRSAGSTLLAVPHNSNASDGLMFSLQDRDGNPLNEAYAARRNLNEPVYEISQIKGTSETHPELSPNDEFAGFELWDYTLSAEAERPTQRQGSYVRQALLDGLSQAQKGEGNPFKYGFIGDSDTHNAAATNEEDNYTGKFAFESQPSHRLMGLEGQPEGQKQQVREFSSGGLAGVWADENTREGIFDAMLRRETFGTSGNHIKVRLFGGWEFTAADNLQSDWVNKGYDRGVPMGGDLGHAPADPSAAGQAPTFIAWAMKDPAGGNLDRIQIVKGWVDATGIQHERIYDVAWSDERQPDATTGKLPPVGNTVDASTATYENSIGDGELFAVWTDPEFDAGQHAFYYLRALEIPTPRWSTRDAVALGVEIPEGLPVAIQERAWSSPIWYTPTP
jgi:hypothetical protein